MRRWRGRRRSGDEAGKKKHGGGHLADCGGGGYGDEWRASASTSGDELRPSHTHTHTHTSTLHISHPSPYPILITTDTTLMIMLMLVCCK